MNEDPTIQDFFKYKAKEDGAYAIAYALMELANAQKSTATWIKYLGNGDASTTMGAIEAFGGLIGEKIDALAMVIHEASFRERESP